MVKEDLKVIGLGHLTEEKIKSMSKEALKHLVAGKVREKVFKDLQAEKNKRKKISKLTYDSLCMQAYLTPECKFSIREKMMWFRWRTETVKVQHNLGIKESKCPLCEETEDTQDHLLVCPELDDYRCGETVKDIIAALRRREIVAEERKTARLESKASKDHTLTVPLVEDNTIDETIPYADYDALILLKS